MERDNVQFAFVAAFWSLTNLDISPQEISFMLVPLGHEFLKMVSSHGVVPPKGI
jgi:hypothetical protein